MAHRLWKSRRGLKNAHLRFSLMASLILTLRPEPIMWCSDTYMKPTACANKISNYCTIQT